MSIEYSPVLDRGVSGLLNEVTPRGIFNRAKSAASTASTPIAATHKIHRPAHRRRQTQSFPQRPQAWALRIHGRSLLRGLADVQHAR